MLPAMSPLITNVSWVTEPRSICSEKVIVTGAVTATKVSLGAGEVPGGEEQPEHVSEQEESHE